MILVDSSVWVGYFRGSRTPATDKLDALLGVDHLATGDLILAEVLQGFRSDAEFALAKRLLSSLEMRSLAGERICLQAARNYRKLRARGVTVRKTIDAVIATWCIENGYVLLHDDRDYDPFAQHLGLEVVDP